LSSAGVQLTYKLINYDDNGFQERIRVYKGTSTIPSREVNYTPKAGFAELLPGSTSAGSAGAGTVSTTTYNYDSTGRPTGTIEPDGLEESIQYVASGENVGKIYRKKYDDDVYLTYEYDEAGRMERVSQVENQAISLEYGEDGALSAEVYESIPGTAGPLRKAYTNTTVASNGVVERQSRQSLSNGTFKIYDHSTLQDGLGRTVLNFDHKTNQPIRQWYYDKKPTGFYGNFQVEGDVRIISLTEKTNQLGKVSAIVHRAGTTLFEYDTLGRITVQVEAEDASIGAKACTSSSVCGGSSCSAGYCTAPHMHPSKMRVYQVTYGSFGAMTSMRYPSGRKVDYIYGPDRRGPTEVFIRIDPNGVNDINRIVSEVEYDVDGQAGSWMWGTNTPGRLHVITKDRQGRTQTITDTSPTLGEVNRLTYYYDASGRVESVVNSGPNPGVLYTSPVTGSTTQAYDYDRDRLRMWSSITEPPTDQHQLTFTSPFGKLDTESRAGGTPWDILYWSGEGLNRRDSGFGELDFDFNWYDSMFVSSIDFGFDGTREVSQLIRGPLGDYVAYTTPNGVHYQERDEGMRRWYLSEPGWRTSFGWGPTGQLTEIHVKKSDNTEFQRDEYIYLQNIPVGVTHTDSSFPGPRSWWLSPDAMGTPRRALFRNDSLDQRFWLVMDAWGKGYEMSDTASYGTPRLPWRLPGQIADPQTEMVENGWRTYVPDLGQYLQPDPMFLQSMLSGKGPQAYAYANGNPLKYSDPTGQSPRDADKIVRWAFDGIRHMTNMGLRNPNPYVNNISANIFFGPELVCSEQVNWMTTYLRERESHSGGLDSIWLHESRESVISRSNGFGHNWICSVSRSDGCDDDPNVLIDPWYGFARKLPKGQSCKANVPWWVPLLLPMAPSAQ
jgi:RHS repeat-associated protein